MNQRIELVDFLRGYSIFTIVVFHLFQFLHLPPILETAIKFGGTGVHLFVLLSGFGLYLSHLKKPLAYFSFLKKRLDKIYIPYIAVVIISAILSFFLPVYENSWYAFGGHVLLYKMFDHTIIGSYGAQLWFISTIIQFYLVFHLLIILINTMSNAVFIVVGVLLSLTWGVIVITQLTSLDRFFLQYLWEFMTGMVIARMLNNSSIQFKIRNIYYLITGIVGIVLYALMAIKGGVAGQVLNDIPALIGYSCLAIFIFNLRISLVNKFFNFTGEISYSLFLVHMLIFILVLQLVGSTTVSSTLIFLTVALLISYAASYAFHKLTVLFFNLMGHYSSRV